MMIVAKAPLRISFLGGTTDYERYFTKSGRYGIVLGSSINHFVYVSVLRQPLFESVKFKFSWRFTESVSDLRDISHPVVREVLRQRKIQDPLVISTSATLPSRSGLGSSSAFCIALLAAVSENDSGVTPTPYVLAEKAIEIERKKLKESGGIQDQYHAAFGGFRKYIFQTGTTTQDEILHSSDELFQIISDSLYLVATGGSRDSFIQARITDTNYTRSEMFKYGDALTKITQEVSDFIMRKKDPETTFNFFCSAINKGWELKKLLSSHRSSEVDELIKFGLSNGASAAKLCGAGGSGFAVFLVHPDNKNKFRSKFRDQPVIKVNLHSGGVTIRHL